MILAPRRLLLRLAAAFGLVVSLATPVRAEFAIPGFELVHTVPVETRLAAPDLRGPLRVRALVWVRWPRTGRPRRWRRPR